MADVIALRPLPVSAPTVADDALALPAWARDETDRRMALLARAKRGLPVTVSAQTLRRWERAMNAGGIAALAPAYKGRQRQPQPWDARALEYIQLPSRMNSGAIAFNLRRDGFADVTPAQVRQIGRAHV